MSITLKRVAHLYEWSDPEYLVFRDGVQIGSVARAEHTYQRDRHRNSRHLTHHDCWYPSTNDLRLPVYGHFYRRRDAVAAIVATLAASPRP